MLKIHQKTLPLLVLMLCFALKSTSSLARDMHGRLGVGYNAQFADNLPAVALKYGVTRATAVEGILGMDTRTPSRRALGAKISQNIFMESNLNFYGFSGLLLSKTAAGSGVEIPAGVGVEFFLPALESIGWSIETGGLLSNTTGSFSVRTIGVSFLNAGIRFYF